MVDDLLAYHRRVSELNHATSANAAARRGLTECQAHPGVCAGDPACADHDCPGWPGLIASMPPPITGEGLHRVHFEPPVRQKRDLLPTPTDFGIEGPFDKPWPIKAWLWLLGAIAAFVGVLFCIGVTAGAVLRHFHFL